jgi:DNA-binding response OmpR family regulator
MSVSMTIPQLRRSECTINGVPHHLTPGRAEFLATLLVASPDHFLRPDDLIEALWPDPDLQPETAYWVLKVYAANLRRMGVVIEGGCEGHRGRGAAIFMGWRIPAAERGSRLALPQAERLAA